MSLKNDLSVKFNQKMKYKKRTSLQTHYTQQNVHYIYTTKNMKN